MTVQPIPGGHHGVTPYLIVDGADRAIAFYAKAFGARELFRLAEPGQKIGHAELEIADSRIMIADEWPDVGARGPAHYGGSPVSIHLYVPDVDAVTAAAVSAGATVVRPVKDQFYGDRSGTLRDPFGHVWHVATHVEDVAPDELQRRAAAV